jgi:hypothetical protein
MVEYATGWVEAKFVASKAWPYTLPMLTKVQNRFGLSHELMSDNAPEFSGKIAKKWHKQHDTRVLSITSARPRGNNKVEQLNGVLKSIMTRMHLTHPDIPLPDLLQSAVNIHNRTPKPSGYSPFFLLYGITPSDRTSPEAYTRENTKEKDMAHEREMARHHKASESRSRAKGLKASRNQVRAYLQKKKAFLRVYAPGNWILRVKQRHHKLEPYYDRPWAVMSCHDNNTYQLRSPGGVLLNNRYNGTNLFPAYVTNCGFWNSLRQPTANRGHLLAVRLPKETPCI